MFKSCLVLISLTLSLSALTLEEKVGQIIMCPIPGDTLTDEIIDFMNETKIGGVILYNWSNDLSSSKKVKKFNTDLQDQSIKSTGLPLFIGIDEEGGRVQRLGKYFPSAESVGYSNSIEFAKAAGTRIGHTLKTYGINLDFAPVVDVNTNSEDNVIGDRAFGSSPILVSKLASAFSKGLKSKGIFSCFKHFPGHGDVSADSHYETPISEKSLDELMKVDLFPYLKNIGLPDLIMTAHVLFPNIDAGYPASLSKIFLQDILRDTLNYKGLIITDSLRMGGILKDDLSEVAINAFNAGNDILLIGGNALVEADPSYNEVEIHRLHRDLVEAVLDGRISEDRLNESIERIIKIKKDIYFQKPIA